MTIKATIIKDSINHYDTRITTFELEYPRFIHAELMTHRMFSRNAASSRAIPTSKMLEQILINPAMPTYWGKSQAGMQASGELSDSEIIYAKSVWKKASMDAAQAAQYLDNIGLHKQHTNRITEPYQQYKVVLTATEFDNFFHLRNHLDAQPEIRQLAQAMYDVMQNSQPQLLLTDEWHVPYVVTERDNDKILRYYDVDGLELTLEQALKVSSSCCAQVSYRLLDHSLPKAEMIYDKLVNSKPVHASPFEHQAKVMPLNATLETEGVTHLDSKYNHWSGNFKHWIQHRQLIKDNYCDNYVHTIS